MPDPTDWWKSAVVYQIYPRSFLDSNGDGVGDLPGITSQARLPRRSSASTCSGSRRSTASPMDDNGYDISNYQDVDPLFGSLTDLDELIAGAHARGIKLVMDLVVNHTSDEHTWFQESRDPESPKRDWYWWRPPREGFEGGAEGAEPNNWASVFSGSAWQYDERRGEYFLHVFSKKQPDLNWENPRGPPGGLRDDALVGRPGRRRLPDGRHQPDLQGPGAAGRHGPARQAYASGEGSVANGPRLHEFLAEMNREVGLAAEHLLTVGEMPGARSSWPGEVTDPARDELNMVFTFEHVGLDEQPGGQVGPAGRCRCRC